MAEHVLLEQAAAAGQPTPLEVLLHERLPGELSAGQEAHGGAHTAAIQLLHASAGPNVQTHEGTWCSLLLLHKVQPQISFILRLTTAPCCCLYIMVADPHRLAANFDACFAPPVSCMWSQQQQQQLPAPVKDPPAPLQLPPPPPPPRPQPPSCQSVSINSVSSPTLIALERTRREGVVSRIHCLEACFSFLANKCCQHVVGTEI